MFVFVGTVFFLVLAHNSKKFRFSASMVRWILGCPAGSDASWLMSLKGLITTPTYIGVKFHPVKYQQDIPVVTPPRFPMSSKIDHIFAETLKHSTCTNPS